MPVTEVEVCDQREVIKEVHQVVQRQSQNPVERRNRHHSRYELNHLVAQSINIILVVLVAIIAQILVVSQATGCLC